MRWIVFDEQTADAVMDKYKRGAAEIQYGQDPLDAALNAGPLSVLIIPNSGLESVLLARIERKNQRSQNPQHQSVVAQFTPLRSVMPKAAAPGKPWWRKGGS